MKHLLRALALLLVSCQAWGGNGFVRPSTDCEHNGTGAAYNCAASPGAAGAWRTMASVVWGASGINTGDTLFACGNFGVADRDTRKGLVAMLAVQQPGSIVTGDCSASGGPSTATIDGGGVISDGMYCDTAAECQDQTWRNIHARNFTRRGHNVRNDLDDIDTVNFTGTNLRCTDIVGPEGPAPWCVAGWGASATLRNITSLRSTDDGVHWEGDNFLIDGWDIRFPGWQIASGSNVGDCVQVIDRTDNARIRRGYCDKRNANADGNVSKSCAIVGDPASGTSSEISDVECYMPLTGNAAFESKAILASGPGARIMRNFVSGGYYGIFAFGANSRIESNIVVDSELESIAIPTTTPAGTTVLASNTVNRCRIAFILKGVNSSTIIQASNNVAANCSLYGYEGFQATRQLANNRCDLATPTCSNNAGTPAPTAVTAGFSGGANPRTIEGLRPRSDSSLIGACTRIPGSEDFNGDQFDVPQTCGAFRGPRPLVRRTEANTARAQ